MHFGVCSIHFVYRLGTSNFAEPLTERLLTEMLKRFSLMLKRSPFETTYCGYSICIFFFLTKNCKKLFIIIWIWFFHKKKENQIRMLVNIHYFSFIVVPNAWTSWNFHPLTCYIFLTKIVMLLFVVGFFNGCGRLFLLIGSFLFGFDKIFKCQLNFQIHFRLDFHQCVGIISKKETDIFRWISFLKEFQIYFFILFNTYSSSSS